MNKLSLVWINKGHEEYWIRTIFHIIRNRKDFRKEYKELKEYDNTQDFIKEYSDGDIVCVVINNPKNNELQNIIKKNIPFFMFNLGDEFIPSKQDHNLYNHSLCQHVFRNYYRQQDDKDKVTAFALGFGKTSIDGNVRDDDDVSRWHATAGINGRKYLFSFAGVLKKSNRKKIINKFQHIGHHKIHECSGWMSKDRLNNKDYVNLLKNSDITLCPRGNFNIDSFRIYEAMEHGSIPLIEKFNQNQPQDYFENILGADCPLLKIPDLNSSDAINFVKNIKDDSKYREDLKLEIIDWWFNKYIKNLTNKILDIIL